MAGDGVDSCTLVGGAEVRWRFSKLAGRGRTAAGERGSSSGDDASAVCSGAGAACVSAGAHSWRLREGGPAERGPSWKLTEGGAVARVAELPLGLPVLPVAVFLEGVVTALLVERSSCISSATFL